ncbi:MAG: hypothetical protein HQL31_04060 [Planctomycetes bacterium]|nr:hypothetical protein [Planctomycetota bacterium]
MIIYPEVFPLVSRNRRDKTSRYFTYHFEDYAVPENIGPWKVNWGWMDQVNKLYGDLSLCFDMQDDWGDIGTLIMVRIDLQSLVEDGIGTVYQDVSFTEDRDGDFAAPVGDMISDCTNIRDINKVIGIMKAMQDKYLNAASHLRNSNPRQQRMLADL